MKRSLCCQKDRIVVQQKPINGRHIFRQLRVLAWQSLMDDALNQPFQNCRFLTLVCA